MNSKGLIFEVFMTVLEPHWKQSQRLAVIEWGELIIT